MLSVLQLIHIFALAFDTNPEREMPDSDTQISSALFGLAHSEDTMVAESDQALIEQLCDDFGYTHDLGDFTFRALLNQTVYCNAVRNDSEYDYSAVEGYARDERDKAVIELVKLARDLERNRNEIDDELRINEILCDIDSDDPSELRIDAGDIQGLVISGHPLAVIAARLENKIRALPDLR
jgi:hypothetical protein